jgi:hypothetical protein
MYLGAQLGMAAAVCVKACLVQQVVARADSAADEQLRVQEFFNASARGPVGCAPECITCSCQWVCLGC